MSWLMLIFFGFVILVAGLAVGYALAATRYAAYKAKAEVLGGTGAEMEKAFKALAGDVLKDSNKAFIELATQNLSKFQSEAKGDLEKRQLAMAELVKPIGEALKKTEEQIRAIEKERKESFGSIASHLKIMAEGQQQLEIETRNLVNAFRRPEVRGRWGELALKRVVELAGMVERCDFIEQAQTDDDDSLLRPDMVVHLAENRTLVVDAKTPLDSYIAYIEASTAEERDVHLTHHARKVRERIKELASKRYWDQFKTSPDFVILFIPGDQFLSAALDKEPELQDEALRQKVLLTTPSSLMGLLKIFAYGWRQVALAENAEQIREHAESLYTRLATFVEHLQRMGSALSSGVEHYNKAIGSWERQVIPEARRFPERGIQPKKEIPVLEPIENVPRLTDDLKK